MLNLVESLTPNEGLFLVRRNNSDEVDVLSGAVYEVDYLDEIPLYEDREVIAVVPFHQVLERGFEAVDDGTPLLVLVVEESTSIPIGELIEQLPDLPPEVTYLGASLSDEAYADLVRDVIENEIGRGEGANFVIRRDFVAQVDPTPVATLAWFRRLLVQETGAYWTFAFLSSEVSLVGASPERHVSSCGGLVSMNPISGTLRHPNHTPDAAELVEFLADTKESEELVMVVDEELKMMSSVCPDGGTMLGPYLKPMSKLTHTEYLLEGTSSLDPREIVKYTMFAPTVTGSPMENACRVLSKYEGSGRGYYSGLIARFTPSSTGWDVDAPIIIRTAVIEPTGRVTVSAGATLVRHSDPNSEAEETRAKAAGVLTALGVIGGPQHKVAVPRDNATNDPLVVRALEERNRYLAPFWRDDQYSSHVFHGSALVIDCGDDFSAMLAHQLRRLGLTVEVCKWDDDFEPDLWDLVVCGPGPGDPCDTDDVRVEKIRAVQMRRLEGNQPLLAVCLSHQILAATAGLEIIPLPNPRQGVALETHVIEAVGLVGYYNTFTAIGKNGARTPQLDLAVYSESETGFVHALIGDKVASVQGHLESVLSYDGFDFLKDLLSYLLENEE